LSDSDKVGPQTFSVATPQGGITETGRHYIGTPKADSILSAFLHFDDVDVAGHQEGPPLDFDEAMAALTVNDESKCGMDGDDCCGPPMDECDTSGRTRCGVNDYDRTPTTRAGSDVDDHEEDDGEEYDEDYESDFESESEGSEYGDDGEGTAAEGKNDVAGNGDAASPFFGQSSRRGCSRGALARSSSRTGGSRAGSRTGNRTGNRADSRAGSRAGTCFHPESGASVAGLGGSGLAGAATGSRASSRGSFRRPPAPLAPELALPRPVEQLQKEGTKLGDA